MGRTLAHAALVLIAAFMVSALVSAMVAYLALSDGSVAKAAPAASPSAVVECDGLSVLCDHPIGAHALDDAGDTTSLSCTGEAEIDLELLGRLADELAAESAEVEIPDEPVFDADASLFAVDGGNGATEPAAAPEPRIEQIQQTSPSPAPTVREDAMPRRTVRVGGVTLSFVNDFYSTSAPERGAALWAGSDSTTDGSWGYFIGHHPGDFAPVMDLRCGDVVSVCDSDNLRRDYTVFDVFDVTASTYFDEIERRVCCHGESVVLQTCVGDGAHYRICVAK